MKAPYRITNQSNIIYDFITEHDIPFDKVNDVTVRYETRGELSLTITYEFTARHIYDDGTVSTQSPAYVRVIIWYDDNGDLQVDVRNVNNTDNIKLNKDIIIEVLEECGYAMKLDDVKKVETSEDIFDDYESLMTSTYTRKIAFNRQAFNPDSVKTYSDWTFIENLVDLCEKQQAYIQSTLNTLKKS